MIQDRIQFKVPIAVKHMFRNKRQAEGKRPSEPMYPPGPENWAHELPPSFAFVSKDEHEQRQNRTLPPAYDYNERQDLDIAYQDAPDPIKQSDFYANGNKIRATANVRVPAYLAISEWESIADDDFEFKTGKLAAVGHLVPQYAGEQLPIDVSPLIPEAEYTTYGNLNMLVDTELADQDGYLYA